MGIIQGLNTEQHQQTGCEHLTPVLLFLIGWIHLRHRGLQQAQTARTA